MEVIPMDRLLNDDDIAQMMLLYGDEVMCALGLSRQEDGDWSDEDFEKMDEVFTSGEWLALTRQP
jgi:hypothetical protein